jgi:hypothetical protein
MVIFQTHVLLLCPLSKMAIVAKIINILLFMIVGGTTEHSFEIRQSNGRPRQVQLNFDNVVFENFKFDPFSFR